MQVEIYPTYLFSSPKNEIVTHMTQTYEQSGNHFKDVGIYFYLCSPLYYTEPILGFHVVPKHNNIASLVLTENATYSASSDSRTRQA
jgi:hypothetical protein